MTKAKKVTVIVLALIMLAGIAFGVYAKVVGFQKDADAKEIESSVLINAKSALLMDYNTGTIVFEKNPDAKMPIASMVKIMTLNLIFEEIANGNLTLDTMVIAGPNATSMGGSQAFLDTGASYSARDLIRTIVVASANDACVAMAEHISGSNEAFINRMNEKAKELGMENSFFANCTGLPAPNGYSSARDVALMTRELINHEIFFDFSTEWMFNLEHPSGRLTELANTNKLVRAYEGCDGGKTGFTNEAAYCLSATAKRGSTRLISVVMGSSSSKERNGENSKLFNHGFANYETKQLLEKGAVIDEVARVLRGKKDSVLVAPEDDFYYFSKKSGSQIEVEIQLNDIKAPVSVGQRVGEFVVRLDGSEIAKINAVSQERVNKKNYLDFLNEAISKW